MTFKATVSHFLSSCSGLAFFLMHISVGRQKFRCLVEFFPCEISGGLYVDSGTFNALMPILLSLQPSHGH